MKFAETISNFLSRIGMTSRQSIERHPFNMRNSTMLFIFASSNFCTVMYLIGGASNLKEYSDSIYLTITMLSGFLAFAFVSLKTTKILRFIENLEEIVSTSEFSLPNRNGVDLFLCNYSRNFFHRTHESNIEHNLHANR